MIVSYYTTVSNYLINIHAGVVGDRLGAWRGILLILLNLFDCLCAHVDDDGVDDGRVPLLALVDLVRIRPQVSDQLLRQKLGRLLVLATIFEIIFQLLHKLLGFDRILREVIF